MAPGARFVRLTVPPVVGAVLLGMEAAGSDARALRPELFASTRAFRRGGRNGVCECRSCATTRLEISGIPQTVWRLVQLFVPDYNPDGSVLFRLSRRTSACSRLPSHGLNASCLSFD